MGKKKIIKIGILGHGDAIALHAVIMNLMEKEGIETVQIPPKNYKGNPFDKPTIKEFPIQNVIKNEPKSKYINKPIRNYRK